MGEKATEEDRDLLAQLGVESAPAKVVERTPREQRIIAGFEEIVGFVGEHERLPKHAREGDIFERIYAVRLDRLRESEECREILEPLDEGGILGEAENWEDDEPASDEALLAQLGADGESEDDISELKHVRTTAEKQAAEEVAQRTPCENFGLFKPLFQEVQEDLKSGRRSTRKIGENLEIRKGDVFIVEGQLVHVAEMGESFIHHYDRPDRRLLVIYDNGTQSEILMRSLQRAFGRDKTSRCVTTGDAGPLFSTEGEDDDLASGHIYVLRSLSEHPFIAENRSVIHKIGVTGGEVKKRIANAKADPTYLLAEVEVVLSFKLSNLNRKQLESLLHKFFASARLDVNLQDRFDQKVEPREWFLLPIAVIEEAIEKLIAGTITEYRYDAEGAQIIKISD